MVTRNAPCQCTRADSVAGCPRHDPYYVQEQVTTCEGHEYVTSILQALARISAWDDGIIDRYREQLNRIDNEVWNMVSDWEAD